MAPRACFSILDLRSSVQRPRKKEQLSYRSYKVWTKYLQAYDIAQDKEEPQKGDHIRSKPQRQELNETIPLSELNWYVYFTSRAGSTHVVPENVMRYQGLVHTGIFVGLEVHECFFGYAFVGCGAWH